LDYLASSSIKVGLGGVATGKSVGVRYREPENEMEMIALKNGWGNKTPKEWWGLCL